MILTVNCAEELLQVVLGADGRIAACLETACGRMNAVLAPAVAQMLGEAGLRPAELSGVACVRGPGGFTGVRQGLAFCHGLCLAAGIGLAGLDYLSLLADSALAEEGSPDGSDVRDELHVLTYSRRAKVYHQAFARGAALAPPLDLPVESALALLNGRAASLRLHGPCRLRVVGSGLTRNAEALAALDPQIVRLPQINPTPAALLRAASTTAATGPPVDALYLRGSDAEENFTQFAALRGLDAQEAQRRLEKALG